MMVLAYWLDKDEIDDAFVSLAAAAHGEFTPGQLSHLREQLSLSWYWPDPTYAAELGVASSWAATSIASEPETTIQFAADECGGVHMIVTCPPHLVSRLELALTQLPSCSRSPNNPPFTA